MNQGWHSEATDGLKGAWGLVSFCKVSTWNWKGGAAFLEPQGLDIDTLPRVMWRERKSCYTSDLCMSSNGFHGCNWHVWTYECIDLHFALLLWSVQRKLSLQLLLHICEGWLHSFILPGIMVKGSGLDSPIFHSIFSNFISDFPTYASHVVSCITINCRTVMAYPL